MIYRNGFLVRIVTLSVLVGCLFSVSIALGAKPSSDVTRIEQDWRIELQSVDFENASPQIISGFPIPGTDIVIQCTWNHLDHPSFLQGGMQFQVWDNDTWVSGFDGLFSVLGSSNEVVTWTQHVAIHDELLGPTLRCIHAGLGNLQATSWGTILSPTEGFVQAEVQTLNTYTPEMSVAESAVMLGANHVVWFGIVETRYYNDKGKLLSTDSTPRVVYPPPAP